MKEHGMFEIDLWKVKIPLYQMAKTLLDGAETVDFQDFSAENICQLNRAVAIITRRFKEKFPDLNLAQIDKWM